jgi:hypothetical protein
MLVRVSITNLKDSDYDDGSKVKAPRLKKARVEKEEPADPIPHCPTNPGYGDVTETMKEVKRADYSYFYSGNKKRTIRTKKLSISHGYEFFELKEWPRGIVQWSLNTQGSYGRGYRPVTVGYDCPTVIFESIFAYDFV